LAKDSGSNLFHLLLCPFCPFFGELTQVVCGTNVIIYGVVVFVVAVLFTTAAGGAAPLDIIRDTVRPRRFENQRLHACQCHNRPMATVAAVTRYL